MKQFAIVLCALVGIGLGGCGDAPQTTGPAEEIVEAGPAPLCSSPGLIAPTHVWVCPTRRDLATCAYISGSSYTVVTGCQAVGCYVKSGFVPVCGYVTCIPVCP